jgi:hypothetical protein
MYGHLPRLSISDCAKRKALGYETSPNPGHVTSPSTSADVEQNHLTNSYSAHSRLCISATAEVSLDISAAQGHVATHGHLAAHGHFKHISLPMYTSAACGHFPRDISTPQGQQLYSVRH